MMSLEDLLDEAAKAMGTWKGSRPCHGRNKMCASCRRKTLPKEQNQVYDWRHQLKSFQKRYGWKLGRDHHGCLIKTFVGSSNAYQYAQYYRRLLGESNYKSGHVDV